MSNTPFFGSYDNLLDSVRDYFSTNDPDVWQRIISGQTGYSKKEWDQIIQRLPNIGTTYSQNGKPLMFFEKGKGNWTNPTAGIDWKTMNAGSSNAIVPVNSTNRFQYPANYVPPNSQAGTNAKFTKGVKSGLTGTADKVVGKIGGAVAAVSVGTSLGKSITQALYDLNPDFWESIGMPEMDASKWRAISTGNDIFDGIFNTLFDLQPDDSIQTYIDENTYAYMAKLWYDLGVFNAAPTTGNSEQFVPSSQITGYTPTGYFDMPLISYKNYITFKWGENLEEVFYAKNVTSSATVYFNVIHMTDTNTSVLAYVSKGPFTMEYGYTHTGGTVLSGPYYWNNNTRKTLVGNAYFYGSNMSSNFSGMPVAFNRANYYPTATRYSLEHDFAAYTLYNNDFQEVTEYPVEGIEDQQGATIPQFPDEASGWSVDDFLQWLQQNLPQLWANPITFDVPDPDDDTGQTVIEYHYIPVPFPDFGTSEEVQDDEDITGDTNQPITGDSTQTDPQIDPQTKPQTFITYIIDIVTGQNDTPAEPDPDTGTGSTPVIPLPIGSTSALFSIYNPTISQLNSFGSWLWTSNIFVQIAQLFNDPMQSIIGLHKIFCTPTTPTTGTIRVGYLDSEVPSKIVSEQYETIDCGEVSCLEYFGNIFDYSPHTSVSLYLPFIGIVPLDVADVMRSFIKVKYHIDVLTGACLAEVYVLRDSYDPVLYTYSGNCAVEYPISHGSYLSILTSILGVAAAGVTTAINPAVGSAALTGAVSGLMSSRATVERSGSFSGNAGAMGIKKPYLIISRPQIAMPKDHQKYQGYPSSSNVRISKCRGFIRVKSVQMEAFIATSDEKLEIEELLKQGVLVD